MNKELINELRQILNVGFDGELSEYEEEENNVILQAITALENSIEFKPFEFPSWEDYLKQPWYEWSLDPYCVYVHMNLNNHTECIQCRYTNCECDVDKKDFPISDQGYTQACEWLNARKRELATQLAE